MKVLKSYLFTISLIFGTFVNMYAVDAWYNDATSAVAQNTAYYLMSANTQNFLLAGQGRTSAMTSSISNASQWIYDGNSLYSGSSYVGIDVPGSVTGMGTNKSLGSYSKNIEMSPSAASVAISRQGLRDKYYLINTSGTTITSEYTATNSQWVFITTGQYQRHMRVVDYETLNGQVNYSQSQLPDSVYWEVMDAKDKTFSVKNSSYEYINGCYTLLDSLKQVAQGLTGAYVDSLAAANTWVTEHESDPKYSSVQTLVNEAFAALEAAHTVADIQAAMEALRSIDFSDHTRYVTLTITAPTAANQSYGISLADVPLVGGSANVPGSFAWANPTTTPDAGQNQEFAVVFTVDNSQFGDSIVIDRLDTTFMVNLNVAKVAQTIFWDEDLPEVVHVGDSIILTAYSGASLPIAYVSSDSTVAYAHGDTLIIVGIGMADITATQAGNKNYEAANGITKYLTVSDLTTAIRETVVAEKGIKFFENGKLYILRDEKRYNAAGQAVK